MPLFDMSLAELQRYRPEPTAADDFDTFWSETLELTRKHELDPEFTPTGFHLETLDVLDASFSGWNGERVAAWLLLPRGLPRPLPAVVQYLGYGGGRSLPYEHLVTSSAGYATLVMDSRGQGGSAYPGVTPDPDPVPGTGQHPGFMTRGVDSPHTYYYRRIMADAARAVEVVRVFPEIDASKVALYGRSQGGGLALATAALVPDVNAVIADVPFLCDFRRATEITDAHPYAEIATYLSVRRDAVERTFSTLSYFDGVNFARRASAPALFGVGLMDDVCPPSTVYAAHNHYAGPKEIRVWPYNAHEGGEVFQHRDNLEFLHRHLR